jgi:hypothetical protein
MQNLSFLAVDPQKPRYEVQARIVDLDRPAASLDPVLAIAPVDWTVTIRVRYTVAPVGGGRPVFDDVVAATGTASGGLTSATRVQKATEAAVQADIGTFLQRLRTEWR